MGLGLGLAAGASPGPLLTLVVSSTLARGFGAGLRVALAPVLTDAPIGTQLQREAAAADLRWLLGEHFHHRDDFVRVLTGLSSGITLTAPGVLAGLLARALVLF